LKGSGAGSQGLPQFKARGDSGPVSGSGVYRRYEPQDAAASSPCNLLPIAVRLRLTLAAGPSVAGSEGQAERCRCFVTMQPAAARRSSRFDRLQLPWNGSALDTAVLHWTPFLRLSGRFRTQNLSGTKPDDRILPDDSIQWEYI
jgi:hypothetical protein